MTDTKDQIVGGSFDVFISYAHEDDNDLGVARTLAMLLESEGYTVWWDRQLIAGQDWLRTLSTKVRFARKVIALCSPRWLASRYCQNEMFAAFDQPDKFVPVLIDTCEMPKEITNIQHVRAIGNLTLAKPLIIAALKLEPENKSKPGAPVDPDRISTSGLPAGTARLFGRDIEMTMLERAWASGGGSPETKTHIVVLHAIGGAGKSALMRRFLDDLADKGWPGAARVYGWSAYTQGTSDNTNTDADGFISAALKFFGHDLAAQPITDPVERGRTLARLVKRERTLLLLDGLEPLQDMIHVNGGRIKDNGLAALIKELAADNAGLVVITSRQELPELVEIAHPRVINHALDKLNDHAGAELLKHLGVHGREADLEAASREVAGHALSVNLLGTYLAAVCAGDVARRDTLKFGDIVDELADAEGDRRAKRAQRVMEAYVARFAQLGQDSKGEGATERLILALVGLFDRPANMDAIAAVLAGPTIPGLTEAWHAMTERQQAARWAFALKRLEALKLVSVDGAAPSPSPRVRGEGTTVLDAHPVVRQHFGRRLREDAPEAFRKANRRLYEHYKALPEKLWGKKLPDTLEEMQPLFAAIAHGCAAGLHQEAFDLYENRIFRGNEKYIRHKLGGFTADLGALTHFFDPPWSQPHPSLSPQSHAVVLSYVGFSLRALGRLREAVEPTAANVRLNSSAASPSEYTWTEAARNASNLSELLLTLGDVEPAIASAREAIKYADTSGDVFERYDDRAILAAALHQAGESKQAELLFAEAERMQKDSGDGPLLQSTPGYRYCDLLLAQGRHEEVAKRSAATLEVWARPQKRLPDIALDTLSLGRAAHQAWREAVGHSSLLAAEVAHFAEGESSTRLAEREENLNMLRTSPTPYPSPAGGVESASGLRTRAVSYLDAAVERLRRAAREDYLPRGILARAAFRRDCRNIAGCVQDLKEAFEIASRGGMRLFLTDIHLEWVRVLLVCREDAEQHLSEDCRRAAEACWAEAHTLVQATSYHRRDGELRELRAALDAVI